MQAIIDKLTKEADKQAELVREIYDQQGMSAMYEFELNELHQIRMELEAFKYRLKHGLDIDAKTPYCL